jgi:tetratricopeptide (TPR) repeat protein
MNKPNRHRKWEMSLMAGAMILTQLGHAADGLGDHPSPQEPYRLGSVHFPISASPAAQKQFDRALAMLHSFWYEELERAFGEVQRLDPSAGMAWWGIAMSLWHPLWDPPPDAEALRKGQDAVRRALTAGPLTERERAYIEAIGRYYQDADRADHATRARAYAQAMGSVHSAYPADTEATAFWALALLATAPPSDRSHTNQLRAADLLEQVARVQPSHPGVVHYLIHAYDSPGLAERGLKDAFCYSQIAPDVPHALHMPSHIFIRLGLWDRSIQSNLAAAAAARDYARRTGMRGVWDEELHALDYLTYAYLQMGRDGATDGVLTQINAIPASAQRNFKSAYAFAAIPARCALERRRWQEAASLALHPADFPWSNHAWPLAQVHFARGLGSARLRDVAGATRELQELEGILRDLGGSPPSYGRRQVEILRQELAGWTASARGDHSESVRQLRSGADLEDQLEKKPVTPGPLLPAREMLGDLLLELGRSEEALVEYERSLQMAPRRFNGLAGAFQAARQSQAPEKAQRFARELVELCGPDGSSRSEFRVAKEFLASR